jgi:hypothetical protein
MIPFSTVLYKPYPILAIDLFVPVIADLDQVQACEARQVNITDPNGFVGITISEWQPEEATIGRGIEPVSGIYHLVMQAMTKNTDRQEGQVEHYLLADALKRTIYRDADLLTAINTIHVDDDMGEHTLVWGLVGQRFADEKVGAEFTFLSSTTLFFKTEIAC